MVPHEVYHNYPGEVIRILIIQVLLFLTMVISGMSAKAESLVPLVQGSLTPWAAAYYRAMAHSEPRPYKWLASTHTAQLAQTLGQFPSPPHRATKS